eukprot:TRINITY_DN3260_c0_g1_i2.p1 TRINITY_DN3260_c0_g1~~TRINITY_DN3260_c0_g1_i2.p1  ORF type:complete len:544 (-),score=49.02 TRINITY_DN3260_c0_g1_i2:64-1695(-)
MKGSRRIMRKQSDGVAGAWFVAITTIVVVAMVCNCGAGALDPLEVNVVQVYPKAQMLVKKGVSAVAVAVGRDGRPRRAGGVAVIESGPWGTQDPPILVVRMQSSTESALKDVTFSGSCVVKSPLMKELSCAPPLLAVVTVAKKAYVDGNANGGANADGAAYGPETVVVDVGESEAAVGTEADLSLDAARETTVGQRGLVTVPGNGGRSADHEGSGIDLINLQSAWCEVHVVVRCPELGRERFGTIVEATVVLTQGGTAAGTGATRETRFGWRHTCFAPAAAVSLLRGRHAWIQRGMVLEPALGSSLGRPSPELDPQVAASEEAAARAEGVDPDAWTWRIDESSAHPAENAFHFAYGAVWTLPFSSLYTTASSSLSLSKSGSGSKSAEPGYGFQSRNAPLVPSIGQYNRITPNSPFVLSDDVLCPVRRFDHPVHTVVLLSLANISLSEITAVSASSSSALTSTVGTPYARLVWFAPVVCPPAVRIFLSLAVLVATIAAPPFVLLIVYFLRENAHNRTRAAHDATLEFLMAKSRPHYPKWPVQQA